jgi:hypothetical protein
MFSQTKNLNFMVLFIQQVKEDRREEEDKDGKLCPHVSERWSEIMFEKIIANFIYIYIYIYMCVCVCVCVGITLEKIQR